MSFFSNALLGHRSWRLTGHQNAAMSVEKEQVDALKKEGKTAEAQQLLDASLDEQARQYFRKMTDGDEQAVALWRRFRDLSIVRYKETYARLNIHFDDYSGESQVPQESMDRSAAKMAELNITEESEGALIVNFAKHVPGKEGKRLERPLVRKRDGTALYLTRDISELLNRVGSFPGSPSLPWLEDLTSETGSEIPL